MASQYNLNEALDALVTLTDRSQKLVHAEQKKKLFELSQKPSIALYTGCSEQFIPDQIKNQRLHPLTGINPDPAKGGNGKISKQENQRDPIRAQELFPQKGKSTGPENQENIRTVESLNFYKKLCNVEERFIRCYQ